MSAGIATRFPLVSRAKPVCRPMAARIAELGDAAVRAEQAQAPIQQRLVAASEVYNKSALIASDCHLPELARDMCWQQWDAFATAVGGHGQSAELLKLSLQPLLNLARQLIRDRQGQEAYEILMQLFVSANNKLPTKLNGRYIPLDMANATDQERLAIRRHLWAALLADGSRALISEHRWSEALELAQKFHGVGHRLLDGRQVLIITTLLDSGPEHALELLDATQTTTPWESAVATTLRAFALDQVGMSDSAVADLLVEKCLRTIATADPSTGSFAARLAATAADLLADTHPPQSAAVASALSRFACASVDAYVAREALTSSAVLRTLTPNVRESLTTLTKASCLGTGAIPKRENEELHHHVQRAAIVINHLTSALVEVAAA